MIAILGDTHFGANGSSAPHHENMRKFFKDFFAYIDKHKIRNVIQLGDLFDVRKHINTWSLKFFRQVFLEEVLARNLTVYVLLGNHDIYYRESLEVSSVEEVLAPYASESSFVLIRKPTDATIDGETFLLVPWVCKENSEEVSQAIKDSDSTYCAGHFEFNGFELFRGQPAKTHYTHDAYKKFKQVLSGHFHHMSSKDNVLYVGTPYELTWTDCNDSKGFFTLSDGLLSFIENKHTLYASYKLSEKSTFTAEDVTGKYVKLKIDVPLEPKEREKIIDGIYYLAPLSLKIIETTIEQAKDVKTSYTVDVSIPDLIRDYVTNVTVPENVDKEKMSSLMISLFVEANSNAC